MELIDTHCHLTFDDLAGDIEGVVERSIAAGVTGWITVGTDPQENHKAVELTERFQNMYAAIAIHPHDARTVTAQTIAELKQLAQNRNVVAIGETGLDYHYDFSLHEDQRRVFAEHLAIAAELGLPVIIHCRKAFDETMEILDKLGSGVGKQKVNEPALMIHTARFLAELKQIPFADFADAVTATSKAFFQLT